MKYSMFAAIVLVTLSSTSRAGEPIKTIRVRMMIQENQLIVDVSSAKAGANMPAASPKKCWKWVDPCPGKGKEVDPNAKIAPWALSNYHPQTSKIIGEGDWQVFWVLGPANAKVVIREDTKGAWIAKQTSMKDIEYAGDSMRLFAIDINARKIGPCQVIPDPPPNQTGCWVLLDCDKK